MTSLRRSAIKAKRSFNRLFEKTLSREGPTSKWPDRVQVGTKLELAAKRAWNAEKRLHSKGMSKERARALRGVPQSRQTPYTNPLTRERGVVITTTRISSGHEKKKARENKAAAKKQEQFYKTHPQTGGETWYSREWKRRQGSE